MGKEKDESKKKREKNCFLWRRCVNFTKRNWIKGLLAFLGIGGCIVVISLACAGWRIVYAPELEPNWDSISAVSSLIGAVGTVAAVWFAIRVADKQNKIDLFEKRHEVFDTFNSCKVFAELLPLANSREDVQMIFVQIFCGVPWNEVRGNSVFIRQKYMSLLESMRKSQFLFGAEVSVYIRNIAGLLLEVVKTSLDETGNDNSLKNAVKKYVEAMENTTYQKVLDKMGKDLKLK